MPRPAQTLAQQTSVVTVAYNSGPFLRELVASIYQTEPEVEVVVVDNASADGAVGSVKAEYPALRIVRSEQNLGFGGGSNLGAARAGGSYLVFVNHDALLSGGWLEALVSPLAEDPSVGLVTPKVLLRGDPGRINVAGLDVHLSGISMCRGLGAPRTALDEASEVAAISGVAFAIRRDLYEALGGFDEAYFLYMEDVDLSLRAWLAGTRCLYVPRAVVQHDYAIQVDARKTFWVERGRYLMLLKAFRPRTLLALVPSLILAEVITWGWILWRNPRAVVEKLRAWGWILTHWAQIAEKRRHLQASRVAPDAIFLARCREELDFAQLAGTRMARTAGVVFGPLLRGAAWLVRR
jgi:GT2 family glycosyltransferase